MHYEKTANIRLCQQASLKQIASLQQQTRTHQTAWRKGKHTIEHREYGKGAAGFIYKVSGKPRERGSIPRQYVQAHECCNGVGCRV